MTDMFNMTEPHGGQPEQGCPPTQKGVDQYGNGAARYSEDS